MLEKNELLAQTQMCPFKFQSVPKFPITHPETKFKGISSKRLFSSSDYSEHNMHMSI